MEAGEKLLLSTSADGRELIRQQIRTLKQEFESFTDNVLASQRELETLLLERGSHEESLAQLGNWLDVRDSLLRGVIPLCGSLEDKKMQLLTYRV